MASLRKGDELWLRPESIDLKAHGVARHDGMIVFIRGALPGERVLVRIVRVKPRYCVAETLKITHESSQRVRPLCPHYNDCGGCSMQHLAPAAQLAVKQRDLEEQFTHIGKVFGYQVLRPIAGPDWAYRYRARLAVRDVHKKGVVLVGFHEKRSAFVADMRECRVLPPQMSSLLVPLRELIGGLSIRQRLPQIEVAIGAAGSGAHKPDADKPNAGVNAALRIAMVLRVLDPPSDSDRLALLAFANTHSVQFWLQAKGPETIVPLDPDDSALHYDLPGFGLRMPFRPTDFTQVNHQVNETLVRRAIDLLDPQPGERIADLFCGLGNFSLPIARSGASVLGLEGAQSLCERAGQAARLNGLQDQARFAARDLFKIDAKDWQALGPIDRVLIDPPREGAAAVVAAIADIAARSAEPQRQIPRRIVYVSCNPATLARDAAVLVHEAGYRLKAACIVNMFPHTAHVESIAQFVR